MRAARRSCPVLTTARLTLTAHDVEDHDDMLAMWREPAVTAFFGGEPSTANEAWARLLRYAGLWPLLGFGYWAARETATGRWVGEVGLAEFRRDLVPSLGSDPETGWVLATWAHGRGFAREAAEAMLAWADGALAARRTVCMIHPDNAASLALAGKLGYRPFAETVHRARPAVLLERFAGCGRRGT